MREVGLTLLTPTNQNSVPRKREYLEYILTRDRIKSQSKEIEATLAIILPPMSKSYAVS